MTDLLEQLRPWLEWLHLHPQWVGVATFFIAFLECLAVIGLLIPGTVIMTAIGALIGSNVVSVESIFIPAALGGFLGDSISYWLGRYHHEHLRDIWPFKFYPSILQKGESFFYKHGGKGIFFGRFLGPIRPILPIIAGMLNMSPWRFSIADILSAILWAPVMMLPGILLGAASTQIAPAVAMHIILYVILVLLALTCLSWLIKRFFSWLFNTIHRALDKLWGAIKHQIWLRPLSVALRDPAHPESHTQLTLGLYFVFISSLFIWLALAVYRHGAVTNLNAPLFYLLRSFHNYWTDHIMLAFTMLGESKVILGLYFAMLFWLSWCRAWRTVWHWALLGIFYLGSVEIIKPLVHSLRPEGLYVMPKGFSFPSGHTTAAACLGGFIAVLIASEMKRVYRWIPYLIITIIVVGIALSRIYLGAHWLTDIVGGLLLASSIVIFITISYRRNFIPKLSPWSLAFVATLSWLSTAGIYSLLHYQQSLRNYAIVVPTQTQSIQNWWLQDGTIEPLFQRNRFGKPAQILNIQWVGNLTTIEENLIAQGWASSPTNTFTLIMNRLVSQNKLRQHMPLFPQLYLDKTPALVMIKSADSDSQTLLVLTLWDSHIIFSNSPLPLWLGTIKYYHSWQARFFKKKIEHYILPALSPVQALEINLTDFDWKQVDYATTASQQLQGIAWDGKILLIKPKE